MSSMVVFLLLLISIVLFDAIRDYLMALSTILKHGVLHLDPGLLDDINPTNTSSYKAMYARIQPWLLAATQLTKIESAATVPATTRPGMHSAERPASYTSKRLHTGSPTTVPTLVRHDTTQLSALVPGNVSPSATNSAQYSLDQLQLCSSLTELADSASVDVTSHIDTGISGNLSLARIDSDRDNEDCFDMGTGLNTDSACTVAELHCSLDAVAIGTPRNLGLAGIDAERNTDNILSPLSVLELMSNIQGADLDTRKAAASTLKCLSLTPDTAQNIAESSLRPVVDLIFSGDDAAMFLAAGILRDISAALPEKQRQLMADGRVIPAMVEILSFCNIPRCRQYAAETLRNLTRGGNSDGIQRQVVAEGGFKMLIRSLTGPGPYESEAEALHSIAPAAPVSLILSQGIVPHTVHVLRHGSSAARQVAAATIPRLPSSSRLQAAFGKSGAIYHLANMLHEDSAAAQETAARALCYLLQCNKNLSIVRRDLTCIAGLVTMLRSSMARTALVPAITVLLYLVPIPRCRDEMLELGTIEALHNLEVQVPGAQKLLGRLKGSNWMEKLLCLA